MAEGRPNRDVEEEGEGEGDVMGRLSVRVRERQGDAVAPGEGLPRRRPVFPAHL
ncbi:hypothetical protein GCM10009801_54230 [Streptomyces albiaxialis]|uniref:Uncharacterized protein n=1 Tax=Streptomyces albiaxialis TaxID=329523 RepID=A0ABP5I0U1_9ACTN